MHTRRSQPTNSQIQFTDHSKLSVLEAYRIEDEQRREADDSVAYGTWLHHCPSVPRKFKITWRPEPLEILQMGKDVHRSICT